jgi:predicted transcriptional regulator with HTH domain
MNPSFVKGGLGGFYVRHYSAFAALHLGIFEQHAQNRVFQQLAKAFR